MNPTTQSQDPTKYHNGVLQIPVIRLDPPPPVGNSHDRPTGIRCPRCCLRQIVYNGNYFCSGFLPGGEQQQCGWALPHEEYREDEYTDVPPAYVFLYRALIASQGVTLIASQGVTTYPKDESIDQGIQANLEQKAAEQKTAPGWDEMV